MLSKWLKTKLQRKNSVQCYLNTLETTLHRSITYGMLSLKLQTTMNNKKYCSMLSWYHSWDKIAQVKTLCSFAKKAPGNIAWKKILCSVVLILLGQHCAGKSLCNVVLEAPNNIAKENNQSMLSWFSWDNIAHVKPLCNVVQETPDHIAQACALSSEQHHFSEIFVLDRLIFLMITGCCKCCVRLE